MGSSLVERKRGGVVELVEVEGRQPLVIAGFLGYGLVGPIAISHIVERLDLKLVAHLRSRFLPSVAIFLDGKLRAPFRIYVNASGDLMAAISEVPVRSEGAGFIASVLLDWLESKGAREIVVLDGFPAEEVPPGPRPIYCASEAEKSRSLQVKGIQILARGFIGGLAGAVLSECMIHKIDGTALLTPVLPYIPDPEGAASLINALNNCYGLSVGTGELIEKAREIRKKLEEMAQRYERTRKLEDQRMTPEALYA